MQVSDLLLDKALFNLKQYTKKSEQNIATTDNSIMDEQNVIQTKHRKPRNFTTKDLFPYFFFGATALILKGSSLTPSLSIAICVENNQVK